MQKYYLLFVLLFCSLFCHANPPPADEVFQLSVKHTNPNTFVLTWDIKKGFFLYQKSLRINKTRHSNVMLAPILFPLAIEKTNARGIKYTVYQQQLVLPVALSGKTPGESLLTVHYQGCSENGFCYPPQKINVKVSIDKHLNLSNATLENTYAASANSIQPASVKQDTFEQLFATHNYILIILGFFSAGLLLAFTPCLLPMIPVLSGIIVGHGQNISTRKAFLLSLCYVLSMAITYSVIGALIAFMGSNLQVMMQSAWAIGLLSVLFVLLALSMFGMYELRLPQSLQNRLANVTRHSAKGQYIGASIMGCLSILVLSPCVTAPLIGALTYIAHEGNVILGMLALFFLSLGMGTPLLLIGTSAGALLPKAGSWMNEVKAFFGVLLLSVAIALASRLLPSVWTMLLWGSLLIVVSLYLNPFRVSTLTLIATLRQGTGLILLCYGFLMLIGASLGHDNPLQPLVGTPTIITQTSKQIATTKHELQPLLAQAKAENKPVMLDFYADWCESCKILNKTTLKDTQVQTALRDFRVITVDLSANNDASNALLRDYHVVAPPTFIFINAQGHVLKSLQLVGDISIDSLVDSAHQTELSPD